MQNNRCLHRPPVGTVQAFFLYRSTKFFSFTLIRSAFRLLHPPMEGFGAVNDHPTQNLLGIVQRICRSNYLFRILLILSKRVDFSVQL